MPIRSSQCEKAKYPAPRLRRGFGKSVILLMFLRLEKRQRQMDSQIKAALILGGAILIAVGMWI
jgi:hypothetical protein